MKWIKRRSKWAWGCSKWEYVPLYVNKVKEEEMEELGRTYIQPEADNHSFSDKFRGIDWYIINTRQVPNSKILECGQNLLNSIKWEKDEIIKDTKHFSEIEMLQGKGRKTDPDEVERLKREKIREKNANK